MARQARIEYPGALHHVRSRGNRGEPIFLDDEDRVQFLGLVADAVRRYGWLVHAWVLMTNHFHFVIETPEANLAGGMRWLLGKYVAWFNKRHRITGHLMGDRYHADLIEKATYLTVGCRYLVLNPVRAGMVARPEDYCWSSFRATAGLEEAPEWLALGELARWFGEPEIWRANYIAYVGEKIGSTERLWDRVEHQIFLGSEQWLKEIRRQLESRPRTDVHPAAQRAVGRPKMAVIIEAVARAFGTTAAAIRNMRGGEARRIAAWLGWYEGLQKLRSIAASLRLSSSGRVSDLVRECERMLHGNPSMQQRVDVALAALG